MCGVDPCGNPSSKVSLLRRAAGGDADHALRNASREVHRSRSRTRQRIAIRISTRTDHEIVAHHADAHLAVEQEREAAEHLSLANVVAATEYITHASREAFVIGHG